MYIYVKSCLWHFLGVSQVKSQLVETEINISRVASDTFLRILTTEVVMGSPWVQFIARESSWHSGWLLGDNFWGNLFPYMILTYDTIYPSHGYTALVEDEICKKYQAILAS